MKHIKTVSLYLFYIILAYMPLHIFISTWFGTSFGLLEPAKVAKDIIMLAGAGLALVAWVRTHSLKPVLQNRIIQLVILFVGLNFALAIVRSTDLDAELLGLAYNTRFLIFFIYALLLANLFEPRRLIRTSTKVVLAVGAVVVLFGMVQYTLLPNDALNHVGYSRSNGVLPAFFIDDKPDLERIMSTVRDPNSLGSYLIIIVSLASSAAIYLKNKKQKIILAGLALATVLCIFWTFSRSALVGALAALAVIAWFVLRGREQFVKQYGRIIALSVGVFAAMLIATFIVFRNTYVVQNIVFHADESTVLEDPNQLRTRFWGESLSGIVKNPLGYGPGTAGLASIRNDQQTVLNENYYLQTGYELGVVGLAVFVVLIVLVAQSLYVLAKAQDTVAVALLASFIGLAITNFLVHIWANEAVAYTWWGLAGLALSTQVIKKSKA